MARRNNNKMSRMPKLEPSVLTLSFAMPAAPGGGSVRSIIDLSQAASLANRRFYRQGLNWGISGIKVISPSVGQIRVLKLPNTWILANSWKKSFTTWMKMNKEALEESPSIRPRFLDFKVFMDGIHHQAGFGANLLPLSVIDNVTADLATPGEWSHSSIYVPNARITTPALGTQTFNEFDLVATGPNYPGVSPVTTHDAVSLIEGYAASRGLPNVLDPNAPDDAADAAGATPENWMTAMFNEGELVDDEVITDMITENNIAPYPFENDGANVDTQYPGGANQLTGLEWHDTAQIYATSATTDIGITTIKGGNFPCGLIAVEWNPTSETSNLVLQVNMIPGMHRGYLAESMQDM